MPRILPRLLQRIANPSSWQKETQHSSRTTRKSRHVKSLQKPSPPAPSFSPYGRSQSILLDEINPIIHRKKYVRHKSFPPRLRAPTTVTLPERKDDDRPRGMMVQERIWWSSPYRNVLPPSTHLDTINGSCSSNVVISYTEMLLHEQVLAKGYDFLIRLAPMRLSESRTSFLPDGLEHPKFKARKAGVGRYIVCWNHALERMLSQGMYKRYAANLSAHSMLSQHISHLLRVRILQEFQLLAQGLKRGPRVVGDNLVLRRLTRAEFRSIKDTGIIPYENGVAVLVVPPLNRDPVTKKRPQPSSSFSERPRDGDVVSLRPLPSVSSLHLVQEIECDLISELPATHAQPLIPLYNGLALFPSPSQRAAFHALLTDILSIERRARRRDHSRLYPSQKDASEEKWRRGEEKASHAFLLCSNAETSLRTDPAPAAIALWRVRMWEGDGWESGTAEKGGWLWKAYKRKDFVNSNSTL